MFKLKPEFPSYTNQINWYLLSEMLSVLITNTVNTCLYNIWKEKQVSKLWVIPWDHNSEYPSLVIGFPGFYNESLLNLFCFQKS